jgi:hypothetical protein
VEILLSQPISRSCPRDRDDARSSYRGILSLSPLIDSIPAPAVPRRVRRAPSDLVKEEVLQLLPS